MIATRGDACGKCSQIYMFFQVVVVMLESANASRLVFWYEPEPEVESGEGDCWSPCSGEDLDN